MARGPDAADPAGDDLSASETKPPDLRLAELLASLSFAIDMGVGMPMEWVLRTCLVSLRLAEAAGLPAERRQNLYYLALLRHVGCTSTSAASAENFGDDIGLGEGFELDFGSKPEAMKFMFRVVGRGRPLSERIRLIARLMASSEEVMRESSISHCEIAERLAERLDFPAEMSQAFRHFYERWDGKGNPNRVKGEGIAPEVRVVHVAQDAATLYSVGGLQAAMDAVRRRSGGCYDPKVAQAFLRDAEDLLKPIGTGSVWDAVLAAEPGVKRRVAPDKLDRALEALADFADFKSPYTLGHSRAVSELAAAAAKLRGLSQGEVTCVRRAALLHDLGRVGVSAAVWAKPGPLNESEWEKVRLHPYFTERILARAPALRPYAELAALDHERADGSGYPKRERPKGAAAVLAAADAYQAMRQDRPHRSALSKEEAARELRREAAQGRFDAEAAEAVLAAAGHAADRKALGKTAGILSAGRGATIGAGGSGAEALSARELEVLRLLVQGHSNKEMGKRLFISAKTVGHHVQHIYAKLDVSSRAGAALFAMQNGLLEA